MGACKSCNTRDEPATFTLGDAPEREPRMSQGRQSGASALRSAVPGNEIPGRNSFLIGAVMTNPVAGSARGSGVAGQQREQMPSMPPCGSPLQPCGSPMQDCGGQLQPCGSVDCQQDQWSGIPVEDRQILQPNYDIGPNPVMVEQTEAEMQPRASKASHKSMNSYGVVPQAPAPGGNGQFTHTFNEDAVLPNDWNSLQQMAAEGKIVIHDESENVQVTHEEISPGVLREVNRGRAGSKYSYYNEATEQMAQPQAQPALEQGNNLQINMMHEVQQTASHRGSRNSNRGSHNHFAQKEAMHATAMTQEVILEEDTESKRLEVDLQSRGVEVELEPERRTSRNSNREVFSDGEEDEQAREGEEENAEEQAAEEAQDQHDNVEEEPRGSRRSGRRTSSKKRSSKRRRRRRTSSKKKSGSQKKRWFK